MILSYNRIMNYLYALRNMKKHRKAFTLIELVVAMAIISLLSTLIIAAISTARKAAYDRTRISDIRTLIPYLENYALKYGNFPQARGEAACFGWEVGRSDIAGTQRPFLEPLKNVGLDPIPVDPYPTGTLCQSGYFYHRYNAGSYGCPGGSFYVIGVRKLSGGKNSSPGFSCPTRNWGTEFDWVTGGFQ